ncbi:dihydrolipoamide dehydrogenase [Maricaulis maris MCS10]|uniref:Dihydrolipoyl dehydrogenase n=1 Tax=Maricaulis maris (strain MCS10) TaxID=394221 RepID=Q0AKU9_MARMM|nr:dihydrolipoyl dehydrogenase [Maricaulis maris]ABI67094.1 dihydrolipoamide dehydrogenase [Maricaulis maris MCS10]
MSDTYDIVIIGGGPGGYNCAIRAGQLGLKTACVEMRGTLGGTCLNVGCIPSKALLHASELYEVAGSQFANLGIKTGAIELDLDAMLGQKDEAVDGLTKGIEFLFKKNGVEYIRGRGRIAGPGKVEVDAEGGKSTLETKNIVIATGSEVTPLPGVTIDEKRVVSSTGALALEQVPDKLVLIGAGVIGLELGSVWRRLGAQVTVVEYLDRILPGMDSELAKTAQRTFAKQGMDFKLGTKVTGVDTSGDRLGVTLEPAAGGEAETIEADTVLVCIGRRPFTDGLGLETVGIETDQRGFIANDQYRTSAENVWVVGDCTHGPMLAHKAEDEGVACAERIAGKAGHVNYGVIPGVVYTAPEIASVGLTEDELKKSGRKYKKGKFPFQANSRARTNHATDGFVKILADAETDEILGAHMIGANVGEMIGELCVAMEFRAASEDIARTCHPHPTLTEAIRQAAMGVEGWTMQS